MDSIKLWSVTFPQTINLLSKSAQTIRIIDADTPRILRLELIPDCPFGPHIEIEMEKRAEMPSIVMVPVAQVANWVPMKTDTSEFLAERLPLSGPIGVVKGREITFGKLPGAKARIEYVETHKPSNVTDVSQAGPGLSEISGYSPTLATSETPQTDESVDKSPEILVKKRGRPKKVD